MGENNKKRGASFVKGLLIFITVIVFVGIASFFISRYLGLDLLANFKQWQSGSVTATDKSSTPSIQKGELATLQAKIKDQEKALQKANSDLNNKNQEISDLQNKVTDLESSQKQDTAVINSAKSSDKGLQAVANTYSSMNPSNAAEILAAMKQEDACSILLLLDNDTKAKILENMPVDQAAALSLLLAQGN